MPSATISAAARAIKRSLTPFCWRRSSSAAAEHFPLEEGCARVGEAMPRIDAQEKVLGTGKYPDDIYLDGMLYGSAVRSRVPPRQSAGHP